MEIITDKVSLNKLQQAAETRFGNFVKAVVDIEKGIMVIDAELHADEEGLLLENGSQQKYLWGINIYPELKGDERIEFNSMINLKPHQNNRTRGVENAEIRGKIVKIVSQLIEA